MINIIFFLLLSFSKEELIESSNILYNKKIERVTTEINSYIIRKKDKTISREFLLKKLNKNKIYSYKILPFTYSTDESNLYEKIKIDLSLNQDEYNQFGISISEKYVTLLLINNKLNISIEGNQKQYKYITIKGTTLDKQRLIYLYIKDPKYRIKKIITRNN